MSLKNIYNRKDFKKVYEIFGGTHGGAGDRDGFANNAKLKDTYLGMLLNSMFKGISWLWRKSKENFVINKMIGRLVNELMRGVIVYCLDNNIDLKTGAMSKEEDNEEQDSNDVEQEEQENYKNKPVKEWTIEDYDNASKTWSIEKLENDISLTKHELNSLTEKDKVNLEKNISDYKTKLLNNRLSSNDRDLLERNLKNSEDQLVVVNNQIEFNKKLLPIFEKNLDEKNKNSNNTSDNNDIKDDDKLNLKPIHDTCVNKYNFKPDSNEIPEIVKDMNIISPLDFKNRYKPISVELILVGDELALKYGNIFRQVKVNSVDVKNKSVIVTSIDNFKKLDDQKVSVSYLRPKNFPNYIKLKKNINEYFKKYVNRYSNMTEVEKQDIEKIYMAYVYLDKLTDEYEKTFGVVESYESYDFEDYDIIIENMLYEFNVKDTYNKSKDIDNKEITNMKNPVRKSTEVIGTSGDVKIKPGEPKAGKISAGKSISQMVVSPTVGDILTKRDKEKFKEYSDNFDIKIYDINLAEIEKTIEKEESSGVNVREKVAKSVNPYNLKVIQITINQLFEPVKTADGNTTDNSKLKLKWNKKVDNTYASFYKIMDTDYISNIMESATSITTGKEFDKSVKESKKIKEQENSLILSSKLPIDNNEDLNLQSFKSNNYYCWYNFTYTLSNKKSQVNTTIIPVTDLINKDISMFKVSQFFDYVNDQPKLNNILRDSFKSDVTEPKISNITKTNVYFLFKKGQQFPHSNIQNFDLLIFNEITYGSGTTQLFLMANKDRVAGGTVNYLVDNNLLNIFDVNKFKYTFNSIMIKRFDKLKFDVVKSKYNVGNLYPSGTLPNTMTDQNVVNILKLLIVKL